ncbi:hypothetical protein FisN_8Lh112 [Fistulifera solaris]|uniref:Man1/Src1 C-terminal domain-containing protein n=1 Tax=Fistulifera solaris TaxID=1519565 RepID=A0A1Z5JDJ9_FISSO|nr:hypothetical protein FisN_8Lh112 [Fistulifera solaris]|eukprot:GAX12016.1 hypothetical protein FisN_8Lh112 [Fistulifera solaris]
MPSSARKRKSDDVSDASDSETYSKESSDNAKNKRGSGRQDRTEDLTPRRKKARTEQTGSMGIEIPEGMTKKEWVAMRKKELQKKYEAGGMFSKNGMPAVTAPTAAKSPATKPSPKRKVPYEAPAASSRPVSRPPVTAPTGASRGNPFPRRPSGPFNSPVPNMQFSASAKNNGPHIPDFSKVNATKSPTEYLSPRSSSSAKVEFVDESPAGSVTTNENLEEVQSQVEPPTNYVAPVDRSDPSWGRFLCAIMCIFVMGISLLIGLIIVPGGSGGNFKMVVPSVSTSSTRCFHDNPKPVEESDEEPVVPIIVERCKGVPLSSWLSCPEGAICSQGLLRQCAHPKYYDVSPGHDECILSISTQKTISDVVSWMELASVVHACQPGGNPYALDRDGAGYPSFGLSQVLGELDIEWDPVLIRILKDLEGVIKLELQPDNNYTVALDENHIVVLPRKCRIKKVLVGVMNGTLGAFWGVVRMLLGWFLQVSSIYMELLFEIPAQTLAFSIVLPVVGWLVVSYLQTRRREAIETSLLNNDRVFVRQEVYKVLRSEPNKNHIVLQVRDQILYDPNLSYHSDSKARNRVIKKVWSKVVADLQKDNRIVKARINTNKGVCDSWKWGSDL